MGKEKRTPELERRTFGLDSIEVRAGDDGKSKIRGHAAVFDKLSDVLFGSFRERIDPGAFADVIKTDDVRALFNHDPNYILGRTKSGTLILEEDAKGLYIEIDPPDTTVARDLIVSIERGDISQMSFSFSVNQKDEEWDTPAGKMATRTIRKVERLYDVSAVTYPAYPQTDVKIRSLMSALEVDYDALSAAIDREEKTVEDVEIIQSTIEILRSHLPAELEHPGDKNTPVVTGDSGLVDKLRRELVRLELS